MWARLFFAICVLLLILAVFSLACVATRADCPPRLAIVTAVECPEWTGRPGVAGERVWWTERATVELDTGTVRISGPIRAVCPELWHVLEWTCAPEYGAGIGNAYQGGPIDYLVTHLGE